MIMCHQDHHTTRRGAILLEVLISMALFVLAASFTFASLRQANNRLELVRLEQQASDIANSVLVELELGTLSIAELRDGPPEHLGSLQSYDLRMDELIDGGLIGWDIEVRTQRTPYTGLSNVQVTVREVRPGDSMMATLDDIDEENAPITVTVHRLIALNEEDPEAYEEDELLDDLPLEPMPSDEDDFGDRDNGDFS